MSEWQPIETAPKDGTRVLLYRPGGWPSARVTVGNYSDERYHTRPRPYWTHDLERMEGKVATRHRQPTHWMPLPAPPAPEAAE